MSIHVGTTDSPVVVAQEYEVRWPRYLAEAIAGRPRLTGGVYYCGQAAWNVWTLARKTRHERRADRWEWLDKVALNLREGNSWCWCEVDDCPF